MTSLSMERRLVPGGAARRAPAFNALIAGLRRCWGVGVLTVIGPDGAAHRLEGAEPGPAGGAEARMEVRDSRLVRRVLASGDIGFADSFIAGEWDSPDLALLLTVFAENFDRMARLMDGHPALRLFNAVAHALNRNSRGGARRNISAHYDLGNDFYKLWLDEGMSYSSALYEHPRQDLQSAQHNKHRALCEAMDLREDQTLLEIGCGWGGFAEYAATAHRARVTAVTLSRAQQAYASQRIQAAGLAERVSVELRDYRDVTGQFDRIASIEMLEAVGETYWPTYFDRLRHLLAPGGRAGLQVITLQERLFDDYRRRPDFIQLNIFPGGMLPTETRLRQETDRAGLAWTGVRRFGQDYAATLAAWAQRYRDSSGHMPALDLKPGFDRLWRYYLAYCEAGFRTRRTDVIQLGLTREG